MTRIWTDDRIAELEDFERLLREARAINSSNNCLERIARCIDLADDLSLTNSATHRPSFREFLRDISIADQTASLAETPASPFDIETMLAACVPGGSFCDPQTVADAIRAYFSEARQ
jgi:hypothetical protein